MRYTEQLKSSWGYHWRLFREIWDMFTLHNWHLVIVGLLFVLCVVPTGVHLLTPGRVMYYLNTSPSLPFAPILSQEIITDYYWVVEITDYYRIIGLDPSYLRAFNYFWVKGSGFKPLTNVLCLMSAGLLLVAYLREGSPVRGREE